MRLNRRSRLLLADRDPRRRGHVPRRATFRTRRSSRASLDDRPGCRRARWGTYRARGDPGSQASRASQDTVRDHNQRGAGCLVDACDLSAHGSAAERRHRARARVVAWAPRPVATTGCTLLCQRLPTSGRQTRTLRAALRPVVEDPSPRRDHRFRSARTSSRGLRPVTRGHRDERDACHRVANWIA